MCGWMKLLEWRKPPQTATSSAAATIPERRSKDGEALAKALLMVLTKPRDVDGWCEAVSVMAGKEDSPFFFCSAAAAISRTRSEMYGR